MTHNQFIEHAKKLVLNYSGDHKTTEIWVVWSVKVLQNSKLLLSTNINDGMYYEVTYNGSKNEIYLDAYKKEDNLKIELDY